MTIDGALNSEVFELYVEHLLVPGLRPGNLVLLDTVKFHSSPKAIELIKAAGARVLHIPAYSPDFNPIEGCNCQAQGDPPFVQSSDQKETLQRSGEGHRVGY